MASSPQTSTPESPLPCTWQPLSGCEGCPSHGKLMCRLDGKDMLQFFMIILPFGVATIGGAIQAGYGWYLLFWLAYSLFFFFVWEAYVLCRHCPFWAEEKSILRCHANYGVIKIWKYQPGPMSKAEKAQFVVGALVWVAFPFPFLLLGQEYLLAAIGACAAISGIFILKISVCNRCVNFSCPMNAVPRPLVDVYLSLNPQIKAAWEASGYRSEKS
ncbi:MAG: hypothetical protein P8Z30_05555 [Acidobacteriota bacterium]